MLAAEASELDEAPDAPQQLAAAVAEAAFELAALAVTEVLYVAAVATAPFAAGNITEIAVPAVVVAADASFATTFAIAIPVEAATVTVNASGDPVTLHLPTRDTPL